ncbi:MAG: IS630 transposase-related protein [Planctomycetaceae bacterium]
MMKSYSVDLRTRVLEDVESGLTVEKAAAKYSVSSRVIYKWKRLQQETGSLAPRRVRSGPSPKLDPYRAAILQAISQDPGLTLEDLRTQLKLPGCVQTLWNALHRWRIVLKKSDPCDRATTA